MSARSAKTCCSQPQWELYNPGDIVGMSGVEQYYNDILMGKNGSRQVLVNSRGKEVGTLSDVPAVPGKQLKLTIDLDLQIAAEEALEGKPGAIVAMNPQHRRDPGDGQPPGVRSQRIRRTHHPRRVEPVGHRSRQAAAEQSHPGAARTRLGRSRSSWRRQACRKASRRT